MLADFSAYFKNYFAKGATILDLHISSFQKKICSIKILQFLFFLFFRRLNLKICIYLKLGKNDSMYSTP